jgi:hypothetical protein
MSPGSLAAEDTGCRVSLLKRDINWESSASRDNLGPAFLFPAILVAHMNGGKKGID